MTADSGAPGRFRQDERGLALVVVLLSTSLLLALGGGLVVLTATESRIAATNRDATAALYAAEAAMARAIHEISAVADLTAVLNGSVTAPFRDGEPAGVRFLPDGAFVDLLTATGMESCGRPACTDRELNAVTLDRPFGPDNPRWQVYGSARIGDIVPAPPASTGVFVVVWVGDDPLETDGDPLQDGAGAGASGRGVFLVRAAAYGAHGVRRRVEAMVARTDMSIEVRSWRELR